jgi:acyl-CoA thioester hydrolase
MKGAVHQYELAIHERHLDTFGHVNNATYLELLEEARWDLISSRGYGLEVIKESQLGPTILRVDVRFRREIKNRQRITVRSWTESYTGKVCTFEQQMLDEQQNLYCEATFTLGLFDLRARKLVLPTPEWLRAVGLSDA